MAHVAKIGKLTTELVQLITGYSPETNSEALKACKDAASKSLKSQRYGSTNQFNVQSAFAGLIEKCHVVGSDSVATALRVRVKALDLDAKWTPEILSLLLLLSDRPAEKANVQDLEILKPPTPPQALTWQDILEDDPLDDSPIWDDVDYGPDFSDEDTFNLSDLEADETVPISPITSPENTQTISALSLILPSNADIALDYWEKEDDEHASPAESEKPYSELHLVRDVLLMFHGLPTSTFIENGKGNLAPSRLYRLENCSAEAVTHALEEVASIGNQVASVREFVNVRQTKPLLQRFSSLCGACLLEFENSISRIEARYVGLQGPCVVSLLAIVSEARSFAQTLAAIAALLKRLADELAELPHRILDELHNECEILWLCGGDRLATDFVHIFASCLEVYWRGIKAWMEEGQVLDHAESFCIVDSSTAGQHQDVWSKQFSIRHVGGSPCAPVFMHEYLSDILTTGKSVSFIKEMGFDLTFDRQDADRFPLEVDLERTISEASGLIPFTALLQEWLSKRLQDTHRPTWIPLRRHLFDDYKLFSVIDALETLFLSKDGSLFISFADSLSDRLETDDPLWDDHATVENLARSIFGQSPVLDDRLITVTVIPSKSKLNPPSRSVHALSTISLSYTFPWPIATIIPPASLTTYQQALTLLLQLRRASLALAGARTRGSTLAPRTAQHAPTAVRHALLHALTTVQQHVAHALHAASTALAGALRDASSVPGLRAAHAAFEARVARVALQPPGMQTARDAVTGLCDVALLFAEEVGAEEAAGVSLGRRRMNRVKGLRGQVAQLRDVLVGELRRGSVDGADARRWVPDDGCEAWHALAEALDAGARRSRKAELL